MRKYPTTVPTEISEGRSEHKLYDQMGQQHKLDDQMGQQHKHITV